MSRANRAKRTRRRAPPSLEDALRIVYELTLRSEKGEENRVPYLHMWKEDGSMVIAALAIRGAGPQFACTTRLCILQQEPAVAVVGVEGWTLDLDPTLPLEQQDPIVRAWLERRARGEEVRLTELPPDYLGETLTLVAENREGEAADWVYRIRPRLGEDGKRRFERERLEVEHNIFHPMFVLACAQREGKSPEEAMARLRTEAREAGLMP